MTAVSVTPVVPPSPPGLAEIIRDTMGTALVAGAGVTLTVSDAADTITISAPAVIASSTDITPYDYGAQGDARNLRNTSVTSGSSTVTNTVDQPFAASDVGKPIWLINAGASSQILATTVASYVSASEITIATAASTTQTNGRCVIGTDDTTAMGLALTAISATGGLHGKALFLANGSFLTAPLLLPDRAAIYGARRNAGGLYLKPGTATVNKYLLKNTGATDCRQSVEDMFLCGLRDFQKADFVLPTDIDLLVFAGGSDNTAVVDVKNSYDNLTLTESCRSLLKYSGKGGSDFTRIEAAGGTYGIDFNAYDCNLSQIHVTAYATGIVLGSSVSSCRFSNVKAFYSGYFESGAFGGAEYACWSLNGASYNNFSACEGQESHGAVMFMNDAKRNTFDGFRLADPGCVVLAPGHGLNPADADIVDVQTVRPGVWMYGASNHNVMNFSIGSRVHGVTNYGTHAVYIEGTCTGNTGRITTDLDLQYYSNTSIAWGTAKTANTSSGSNTGLTVDGVAFA